MFMRRRPLLRAAVVGGGAYMAGKKMAERSAEQEQQEADQDARISNLEQQQGYGQQAPQAAAPQAAAPGGAGKASLADQLKQLTELHDSGSLSDSEFAAAKRHLLGI